MKASQVNRGGRTSQRPACGFSVVPPIPSANCAAQFPSHPSPPKSSLSEESPRLGGASAEGGDRLSTVLTKTQLNSLQTAPGRHLNYWKRNAKAGLATLLAFVGLLLWAQVATSQTIGSDVLVNYGGGDDVSQPQVAALGDTVVALDSGGYNSVYWSISVDAGRTWTNRVGLWNDGCTFARAEASLCADGHGNFYAVTEAYTCRSGGGFVALVLRGATSAGQFNWGSPVTIPLPNGPIYDFVRIACDRDSGFVYVTYTNAFVIMFMRSMDHGATWSAPQVLSNATCNGGKPAVGPDGEVYVTWMDYASDQSMIVRSDDHGQTFGPAHPAALLHNNISYGPPGDGGPNIRDLPTSRCGLFYQGFPSIDVDRTSGPFRGRVYLTWAGYASGTVSPQVDAVGGGGRWFALAQKAQFGSDISGGVGSVDNINSGGNYYYIDGVAGTTLEVIGQITYINGSVNFDCFHMELLAGPDTLMNDIVCVAHPLFNRGTQPPLIYTFPKTGRYYVKMSPAGHGYGYLLKLRQLIPDPNQAARDARDILMVSSSDGGASWTSPVLVNDTPQGFDESIPVVAVDAFGKVNVSWYDRREDPYGFYPNTYWSYSRNGGLTFEPSRKLSSAHGQRTGWTEGDDMGIASGGTHVYCVWTDDRNDNYSQYNWAWGAPIDVSGTTLALASGFEVKVSDAGLVAAWDLEGGADITGLELEQARAGSGVYSSVNQGPIPVHGSGSYRWVGPGVPGPGDYRYRLRGSLGGGGSILLGEASLHVLQPSRLRWIPRSANPFRNTIDLSLELPRAGHVLVRVLNVGGGEVARVLDEPRLPGTIAVHWSGIEQSGAPAPSGRYILSATMGGESASSSVTLIR